MSRPRRLANFDYRGAHLYFITMCAGGRRRLFDDPTIVDAITSQLLRTADERGFDLLAFTFMPDHVHLLVRGRHDARLQSFLKLVRQRSAMAIRSGRRALWQDGVFEHVLRREESAEAIARYIADNPVRAGLVERAETWPWSGGSMLDALWRRAK